MRTAQEQQERDELENILFQVEGYSIPVTTGFCIDCPDKAAWAARKIIQAEERVERQKLRAIEYRTRIDEWFDKTTRKDTESIEYLRSLLRPFAFKEISGLKKGKTLKYLGVTVAMRKLPDKAEITDEKLALQYCERHLPFTVEVKKTLIRSELRKVLNDGRLVPGVELVNGTDDLYVTADTKQLKEEHGNAAA